MRHIKTIGEFHHYTNLPRPHHPLISVIDVAAAVQNVDGDEPEDLILDFYSIAVKRMYNVKGKYGQQPFDFNEGVLSFMAPKQVFSVAIDNEDKEVKKSGWAIYIHPDFIWNTHLAKTIKSYDFWDYSLNEALFLSGSEEAILNNIIHNIWREVQSNIDKFTKQIIISQIEGILSYSERFYGRQFITREKTSHQILDRLEARLDNCFSGDSLMDKGLPTVRSIAEELQLSPKYLTNLLQVLTGQSTQQHIHNKLIEKAKERLSTSELTVSEISYSLGFEHIQSFSKLFKSKTNLSPNEFRRSFN